MITVEWNDFEKDKPTDGQMCITSGPMCADNDYSKGRYQIVAMYSVETDEFYDEDGFALYRPSHWTPKLPDPI